MTRLVLDYSVDDAAGSFQPPKGTLVLLHGFPDTPALWLPTAEYFTQQGYRTIRIALPGFAGKGAAAIESVDGISFDELTSAIHDVLTKENALGAAIVGHDWGAVFVYLLTTKYPESVSRAICLEIGSAPRSLWMLLVVLSYQSLLNLGYVLGSGLGDWIVRFVCRALGAPRYEGGVTPGAVHAWLYRQAWREAGQRGPGVFYYRNLVESWRPLPGLPFLFMYGGDFPKPLRFHTSEWRTRVSSYHPQSRSVALPGKHWFMHEHPLAFHEALHRFLEPELEQAN